MTGSVNLKELPAAALHQALAPLGVTPSMARRIQAAVLRRGVLPFDRSDLSAALLHRVAAVSRIPGLTCLGETVSARDGFRRLLLRGDGPETFESVGIPLYRGTPKARAGRYACPTVWLRTLSQSTIDHRPSTINQLSSCGVGPAAL